eukprot:6194035-Pleurochrysis_carterae.AAC.1
MGWHMPLPPGRLGQVPWPEGCRALPLSPTLVCRRVRILAVAEDPSVAHAWVGGGRTRRYPQPRHGALCRPLRPPGPHSAPSALPATPRSGENGP